MFIQSLLLLSVPVASVYATATPLQLNEAKANFQSALIVPENLKFEFNPSAVLNVTYPAVGTPLKYGQAFNGTDSVQQQPEIVVDFGAISNGTNSTTNSTSSLYTIALFDVDVAGSNTTTPNRHWLVNGIKGSSGPLNISNGTEDGVVVSYKAPGPPAGTGPHRYAFLLFKEPSTFNVTKYVAANNTVNPQNLNAYVSANNLTFIAGTYMQVSHGTEQVTVSVASTSVVQTSTLPTTAASSTGSSSSARTTTTATVSSASSVQLGFAALFAAVVAPFVLA